MGVPFPGNGDAIKNLIENVFFSVLKRRRRLNIKTNFRSLDNGNKNVCYFFTEKQVGGIKHN